jgi:hypothetical protein
MNPTVLVMAVLVAGVVGNRLIRRLNPTVSRQQIFCASAAWVGGTLLVAERAPSSFWWYTGLIISVVMGTFLIMELLQPRNTPRAS